MIIYIIIFAILYTFIYSTIDGLYFEPSPNRNIEEFNNKNPKYNCIKKQNHYALFRKGKKSHKVMLIAHGNAGSFLDRSYVIDKLEKYTGDVYMFEYPGFSGIPGRSNITNCVNELLFWINSLKPKYEKIDLFGESIGGGIVIETCVRHSLNCINKIYLQSSFTSMKNVIKDLSLGLYILYKFLLLDDLNNNKNLKNILCNKFVIIHSPDDMLIKYEQALQNYETLKKLNKKVKFIEGSGFHGNTLFELKK
jgi:esterase/lipase